MSSTKINFGEGLEFIVHAFSSHNAKTSISTTANIV